MRSEDDWSFVIKLHAVFEATATDLLAHHFKEEALTALLARLELSNKTTGKLAFLKALELMGSENRFEVVSPEKLRELMKRAREDPKLYIWVGGHNVLISFLDMYSYSDYRRWEKARVVFSDNEEGH